MSKNYANEAQKALETKIKNNLLEASKLENQRGLSAREAVDAMAKAKQLRADADWMSKNQSSQAVRAWLYEKETTLQLLDSHAEEAIQAEFGAMQDEIFAAEEVKREAINDVMNSRVAFNMAIGVDRRTLERQVGKLLDGQGSVDEKGRKYVRFSEGNSGTFRAVMTKDGYVGFISDGRGEAGDGFTEGE